MRSFLSTLAQKLHLTHEGHQHASESEEIVVKGSEHRNETAARKFKETAAGHERNNRVVLPAVQCPAILQDEEHHTTTDSDTSSHSPQLHVTELTGFVASSASFDGLTSSTESLSISTTDSSSELAEFEHVQSLHSKHVVARKSKKRRPLQPTKVSGRSNKEDTVPKDHAQGLMDTPQVPSMDFGLHPLESRWVLWYLKSERKKDWEDCLQPVSAFDTVEGFWALYKAVLPPSQLNWNTDYYVFREGIKPMWEDEANERGGRWVLKVVSAADLDQYWLDLLMTMTGGQFGERQKDVCGAVVNVRQKGHKMSLWTVDCLNDDANLEIGNTFRKQLELAYADKIRYEIHKDVAIKLSSCVKPRLVLPPNGGAFEILTVVAHP